MADTASQTLKPGFSPLNLQNRSVAWQIAAIGFGTLFLALSSLIELPIYPVPVTMQTFAVTLVGALYGWRLGAATVIAWLVEGAMGLPVLSGGGAGLVHFAGPTAGYLFAFPVVAALVGWLAERGWNGSRVFHAFAACLLGNATCLMLGAAWLALAIGLEQAFVFGVAPFIIGGVLKSALTAATLAIFHRRDKAQA